jgi:hypothetical protein
MELLDELHKSLAGMMRCIESGGRADAEGMDVGRYLEQIGTLRSKCGDETPQMLLHYLDKRSYTKALDLLEGRDETVAPNC